jgi:hypothetical protein
MLRARREHMRITVFCGALLACGTPEQPAQPDAQAGDVDAPTCGGTQLDLSYVAPNLMLVLDRSCSMDKPLTGSTTTKWSAAVAAVNQVLADHASDVRWGLTLFPDRSGETCAQDEIAFPVADQNQAAITTALTAALVPGDPNFPEFPCVTNIDTGIARAGGDPALADPARKSYLMLVSDGAQSGSCEGAAGDARTEAIIGDLFTNRGIPTFVVGFGSGVDVPQLNRFADHGGMPLAGTTRYYQADTATQLEQAFAAIAEIVVRCDFVVDPPPPDLDLTHVVFEGVEVVPRDPTHTAGWDFDPATNTMTFYGSYCTQLESRAVDEIDVTYGCPSPPVL